MNAISLEYKQKVWRFLEKIEPDKMYTVAKLTDPATRGNFIAAVKEYMDSLPYGGWISFNSDYTKFYRSAAVPMEQLEKYKKE